MGQQGTRYILGIDLGVISVGWAAIEIDAEGPRGILATGVRSWDLSNANLEDVERGREEPPSQLRRQARQLRRQLFRRAQRLRRTYRVLQKMMLFPSGLWSSTARDNYLRQLDAQAKTWLKQNLPALANNGQLDHTLVYRLRAAALDVPLPPELLGRVFFHLAQRRGYVTNRRSSRSDDERGVVEAAISQLTQDIKAAGARTLGEFLAQLNPHEQRIRGRYTSRRMFQEEFELIWQAQQPHYPDILTEQNRDLLFKAIFFQRPLKSQARLIGRCPLETALRRLSNGQLETIYPHRRAPMASLEAQRIRYMQRINDLEFIDPEKNRRVLTQQEREQLYRLAETQEDLSFTEIKRFLGIPTRGKGPGWTCNLEEGGEKKIPGNRTATRIRKVLGDESWEALGEQKQKLLVDTIIGYVRPEALVRHLQTAWGFDAARAEALARIELEDGYHSFSRRAIRKLLPLLAQGMRLNAAIQRVYGGTRLVTGVHNTLPPVRRVMTSVRNPILIRALTELRKVINHLVARFGKPEVIRVELARELKRNRKQRQKLVKRMRQQEDRRSQAAKEILRQFGRTATARDIEKYLLAEECNWTCPYTGREITLEALLGDHPQFDVEHIWPFHRSLDDSFLNKTLCYHEENRNRKRGNTPYEA
ncbi:MAG: type II CRISPR RNA-guided endonuclease Cas9, partial [Candidatus Hadarchaeum sp.]